MSGSGSRFRVRVRVRVRVRHLLDRRVPTRTAAIDRVNRCGPRRAVGCAGAAVHAGRGPLAVARVCSAHRFAERLGSPARSADITCQLFSEDVVVSALHQVVDGHVVGLAVGIVVDQLRDDVGHVVAFGPLVVEPALVNTEPDPEDGGEAVAAEPLRSGAGRLPGDARGQGRAHGGGRRGGGRGGRRGCHRRGRRRRGRRRRDYHRRGRRRRGRRGRRRDGRVDAVREDRWDPLVAHARRVLDKVVIARRPRLHGLGVLQPRRQSSLVRVRVGARGTVGLGLGFGLG
eukprot:scaffold30720_cov48-Phaeocystis_antarctica.AAC.3